jgi:hypothetical protein
VNFTWVLSKDAIPIVYLRGATALTTVTLPHSMISPAKSALSSAHSRVVGAE